MRKLELKPAWCCGGLTTETGKASLDSATPLRCAQNDYKNVILREVAGPH